MPIFVGPSFNAQRFSTPGLGYRAPLANGDQGTAQTIAMMRRLVDNALSDSAFVRKAVDIVRPVAPFDDAGEVQTIYDWVRRNIRFVKDPVSKEKLYPPQELLKIRSGDCDDISMLLVSLLGTVGYPSRFVTISTNAQAPNEFTHVYVETETPPGSGNWIPLDAARLDSSFGTEPAIYYRKRAWDAFSDHYVDLSGNKRRMPKLNGYSGLGQDGGDGGWSSINWQPIVSQSIAEIPAITAAVSGRGTATSPYASYSTPYTPGYGLPAAGYTAPGYPSSVASFGGLTISPMMMMVGVAFLFVWLHGRGGK